ncbi:MAG TPA: tetratricopeptide repeat protein, partial [Phycisphaerales bacterium]|nr:tetratricopeptide repeat protein [Phycisphaerales bacterium]
RTAKFVRRNLTVVVLGVAVFLTLLAGIAATGWQALRAEAEYKAANETNRFLQDVLLSTEPERARGQTVTMRMALDEAARKLDAGSIQSERVRASLHGAIGRAYWSLGEMEKSEKHGRAAVELRERFFGKDSREYLDGVCDLAVLLHDVGRDEEAAQISVPAMERSRRLYGAIDQTTVRLITAAANALRDDAPTSLKLYEEAIEIYRKLEGEDGVMTLMASNNLSAWHMDRGDFATAEAITRDVLARRIRLFGEDHPDVFVSMRNLGTCLRGQGRLDEAAEILATCVTSGERVRGIIHPSQLRARLEYGIVTAMKGDPARAELIVREGLPHTLNSDGSPTPLSNEYYGVLGEILAMLNKVDEGLEMAQKAVDAATMLFGMDHPEVQRAASVYVSVYQAAKDWANARRWNDRTEGTPYYQESLRLTPGQDPASPPLETAPSGPP